MQLRLKCHFAALLCEATGASLIFLEARRLDALPGFLDASYDNRRPLPGYGSWIYHSGAWGFALLLLGILVAGTAVWLEHRETART
jgi:hypothetical protein